MRGRLLATSFLLTILSAVPVRSGPLPDWIDLRVMLESELAVETRGGDLQKWDWVVTPELEAQLSDRLQLTAIPRFRLDASDELEPGRPRQDTRADASQRFFVGTVADFELRELYVDATLGRVFVRAGKQQVVWGQADGLRVLDVVHPLSYREFILPEFEDRRIPLWTLNTELPVGWATVQLLWIPDLTYDEAPERGATFAFTSPRLVPQPPPGVPARLAKPDKPGRWLIDSDAGLRLSAFLGGWDLTLNYLYHYQDQPVLRRSIEAQEVVVTPGYERTHLVGGTLSRAIGDFTLRAEAGYSTRRFFLTEDATDADGVFGSGDFAYVVGLDYQLDGDTLVSGQVFQSVLTDRPGGAFRDRTDTQLTLLVQREFLNDTIAVRVLGLQSTNDGDGMVQIDLSYQLRSNVTLRAGADFFYGSRRGLFGEFDDADRVTLGIEVGL